MKTLLATLLFVCTASIVQAQTTLPPPAGPVVFCGVQTAPTATSYKLVFDGGAQEDITLTPSTEAGPAKTWCDANAPSGWTHSFTIAANRFSVRPTPYSVVIVSINSFGETTGVAWNVSIGMKPGQFTPTAAGQLPGD